MTDDEKRQFLKKFGLRVKKLREQQGFTQEYMALKCDYTGKSSRAAFEKIESGKINLPLSKLRLIAQALGVTESYLMGWEEPELGDKPETLSLVESEFGKACRELLELASGLDNEDCSRLHERALIMLESAKYQKKAESKSA